MKSGSQKEPMQNLKPLIILQALCFMEVLQERNHNFQNETFPRTPQS